MLEISTLYTSLALNCLGRFENGYRTHNGQTDSSPSFFLRTIESINQA